MVLCKVIKIEVCEGVGVDVCVLRDPFDRPLPLLAIVAVVASTFNPITPDPQPVFCVAQVATCPPWVPW
jgi:hypothetical protein